MKKFLLLTSFANLIFNIPSIAQNIAINNDGSLPVPGAMLDIKSSSKGILIPRISLTGTNDILSVPLRIESLLIYNTSSVSGLNAVAPGFYYWNGTLWVRFTTNTNSLMSAWLLGGNPGTSASTHFIGTTDNNSLVIKVNNQKAGYVGVETNDGNVFWGYKSGLSSTGYSNVGIGIKALFSNLNISNLVAIGDSALFSNTTGYFNTALGSKTLFLNTTGRDNTANGHKALHFNTIGNDNSATGLFSLYMNSTGSNNTANGTVSLYTNTTGNNNTAMGVSALQSNTAGDNNIAMGHSALFKNTYGYSNVGLGIRALFNNTTTSNLVAVGDSALFKNNSGSYNTSVGSKSLYSNINGNSNTANGYQVLYTNTSGDGNTANGYHALHFNTFGSYNTAIGYEALQFNESGLWNTAVGLQAFTSNTNGSKNTALGFGTNVSTESLNNATAIGANSLVGCSNCLILGSITDVNGATSSVNVGIGTTTPLARLSLAASGSALTGTAASNMFSINGGLLGAATGDAITLGSIGFLAGLNNTSLAIKALRHSPGTNWTTSAILLQYDVDNVPQAAGSYMAFSSNGNIGYNTTLPTARVQIQHASSSLTPHLSLSTSGANYAALRFNNLDTSSFWDISGSDYAGNRQIVFYYNGFGSVFTLTSDGYAILARTLTQNSDIRLKKNIIPLQHALSKITQLNGYTYQWKMESSDTSQQIGVIAQEVQKLFPELVKEDNKGILSVNYSGLIPVLIESIKEQQKEIEKLRDVKTELDELKKIVEKLSAK